MNQIVPYVPPQPSDPLMEKISRLERAVNKLSRDKYDVADLENLSLYPKVRLPSFLRFGYEVSFEALDKGAIEILGPYGISYTFRRLAERISQLQSGFVVRRVRYDPWPPAWSVRPRGCKKIDRGGYIAGVVSVVCHEVPMDKGNHRFWAQAALYHPSHCIPSSRIVLYRTKPDTSIE
ncbi:hypothetical protein JHK87_051912 [Glycine soja]|nr:hypothetical protein JHK87_051912 [Glycine soja]